jgi:dTDP-4-dehydrorhamnose 3,5-epimerase
MEIETFLVAGPVLLRPKKFEDARGFFSEVYNEKLFNDSVGQFRFVQDNLSLSRDKGVVRGLHFQSPPYAQGKLVRVARGAIFDVAVDIRQCSPTYGKSVSAILSRENWLQLWVPPGFAHGFCTLEPDTEVNYKVTALYRSTHDFGLAWDDPELGIPWPVTLKDAILSDKDRAQPGLKDLPAYFE